jgi:hypothetical protein
MIARPTSSSLDLSIRLASELSGRAYAHRYVAGRHVECRLGTVHIVRSEVLGGIGLGRMSLSTAVRREGKLLPMTKYMLLRETTPKCKKHRAFEASRASRSLRVYDFDIISLLDECAYVALK